MKNNVISRSMVFVLVLLLNIPLLAFAQWSPGQGLVPCDKNCGWDHFIQLINNIITFALYLATILAVLSFVYAGFLMMTAGGNDSQVKKAKDIFYNVIIGLVFAYGAWILVYFILEVFRVDRNFRFL